MVHVRKYDGQYSRRKFLSHLTTGVLSTGVLKPLWAAIAHNGEIQSAYPHELLSIEEYTKGQLSTGGIIDANNVDAVKELIDPIQFKQIKEMGRVLKVLDTTTEIMKLGPWEYIEATLSNQGQARFDETGNVVVQGGKPWIGGNPFPNPKSAIEVIAGATLSWGRHDASFNALKEYDLDPDGRVAYRYESCWTEFSPVARTVLEPKPYLPGHEDKLRFNTIFFLRPNDIKGTSYLNIWPYDQRQFPKLYGYLPAFKRVRQFPTNQRFEPLIPGSSLYLSDAWATGDPFLTWGNYRVVHRGPGLGAITRSWNSEDDNWENKTIGGPTGESFWQTNVELIPEVIVIEAEPIKYPRAPVSKKRVWFDARTLLPYSMVSYDRRGEIFRSFDGAFSIYNDGDKSFMDGKHPYWSWTKVHAHNTQTNRITRIEQVKEVSGGYRSSANDPTIFEQFMSRAALRRLGV